MAILKFNARRLAAVIGVTAAAGLVAFTGSNEGVRLAPYNDTIGAHRETVCFGETNVPMRLYTLPECKQILANSLASYATEVRSSTPGFDQLTDGQKFAAIDYTYNRGAGAWRATSTKDCTAKDCPDIRSAYIARDFPAACGLYMKWTKVKRRDKWVDCSVRSNGCYGIYTRRARERAACLGE